MKRLRVSAVALTPPSSSSTRAWGADLEALPWIPAALHDRGYRFVRLDALFT
jgi:peptidoglycan/xylan/chitin deacetylase (PgdA/CDA1 family)